MEAHSDAPQERLAQTQLSNAVTELIHGADAVAGANTAARVMFGSAAPTDEDLRAIQGLVPETTITASELGEEAVVEMLVASGLASSKRDARQALKDGAVRWNGEKVDGSDTSMFTAGRIAMLQKGKRNKHLIVIE